MTSKKVDEVSGLVTRSSDEMKAMAVSYTHLAPEKIVGMIYHAGGLIPVFRPEKGMKTVSKKAPACVVLIRKEDGSLYGMAADEVTGGGAIDPVYE